MAPEDDITRMLPLDDVTIIQSRPQRRTLGDAPAADDLYGGDYSLRGAVGAGGVGRVLLGFDQRIGREVAIKEMLDQAANEDMALNARFLREARITGRLEHPSIVPVYDLGVKQSGAPYYVMRLVRGDTLAKALKECNNEPLAEHALSKRLALLDRVIDVCEALAYAHSKGVVHRDLKPGNIVLGPFGETIVLDWGLAKVENEAETPLPASHPQHHDADLTQFGDILGTPAYMAPEQADPEFGEIDARSDVFALGCILYYLLNGRPPLQGNADQIMSQLVSAASMPDARNPKLAAPAELIAICNKALSKRQSLRFKDAGALAEELRAFRDGRLVNTYAYTRGELLRRFIARNKLALSASAAVLVSILAGAGLAFKFGVEAHQARQVAEAEGELAKQQQQRAEQALADVTRISNANLSSADTIAAKIGVEFEQTQAGLTQTAARIKSAAELAAAGPLLESLLARYPRLVSVATTRAPGTIVAVAPDQYRQARGADTSQLEHNRQVLQTGEPALSRVYPAPEGYQAITLVVPVRIGNTLAGFVSGRFKAAELLGELLAPELQLPGRTIWVIQDDGLILFDTDRDEIGLNLFREERYAALPELRELARHIAAQDAGVGYYQNPAAYSGRRIASWVSLRPVTNREWKVVVLEAW
ncbi:serine/threonine protein kinase [Methylomonas sp. SURF-1]|uniref:Serine/threonine protein kinase n=1 Tax=Methylomonas aurea TaxID=2952224 RepID=A0ABT1UK54_9GAMM|nr:serine/threonine protein kinase [Methylomonas sp. SURF-1]MCQ8182611.1 serine/threonine protein kinase [Methylomonas sp. SURF-1]